VGVFIETLCIINVNRFPEVDKLPSQVLQLDEVSFYYSKESPVFQNVCLSANMDSRICIVSGSGRSFSDLLGSLMWALLLRLGT